MTHLGFAPTSEDFAGQVGLCLLNQLTLLRREQPLLIAPHHPNPLLCVIHVVEDERIPVNALFRRNVRWPIWDMATNIDIKGVGFPIDDGHCNARLVGTLDFCQQSRYKEEVGFALTALNDLFSET
jgi:hypothetical protein